MLVGIGDNCIDRYLSPIKAARVGGNALNVAANIAIRGEPAAYAGVVGKDDDGDWVLRTLRAAGIDTSCVLQVEGVTGVTEIAIDGGDYRILREDYGVSASVVMSDALRAFICDRATLLHTTVAGEAGRLLPELRGFGVPLSVDLGIVRSVEGLSVFSDLLGGVSYAFFSAGSALDERAVTDLLERAQLMGCSCVVATRGAAGTIALQGGRWADAASVVVPGSIVDPLGAGDAFIAGFLQATDHGRSLNERLQQASVWAAEACLHLGAWVVPGESETA